MKISLIRGAFTNPFELQNFYPLKKDHDIRVFSSLRPLSDRIDLPLTRLPSPTDLPNFSYKYPLLNRVFTDAHYLLGLDNAIAGSDIAHVAETYFHYTQQAIDAKQLGKVKRVVSTVWEIIPYNNEGIPGRKQFKENAREHIDHFITPTTLAKQALIKEGTNEQKITVIPPGVDLKRFTPNKAKRKTINILSVARLVEEKGIGDLVKVFQRLKNSHEITLTLVGSGPLEELISGSGITIKRVEYSQIQREYQNADIFCLLSKPTKYWQEQYGMVLVEAMACGLPVIATSSGAIPEVVGKDNLLIQPGDQEALSQQLEKLITSIQNR